MLPMQMAWATNRPSKKGGSVLDRTPLTVKFTIVPIAELATCTPLRPASAHASRDGL
jgi:hypothetical protein